ncbi:hypothetical protein KFL_000430390 [Klebsormidium nitens]|uniref:Uncharacterized protein n=1 Tax=Klebsormidium nitens TaxID=105231 RepID=A0A1Y1HTY4_KLENI|nr:hypothetical protein KFL_000430390 [Klebsormidium nitens]|eukprot:GAQ79997.1 hypothetical protein KFL_000430390 [Klebsormidium nitens]
MAATAAAASTLSPACLHAHLRSSANERAYASGPASTSGSFFSPPLRQQRSSKLDLGCWGRDGSNSPSLHQDRSRSGFNVKQANPDQCRSSGAVKVRAARAGVLDRPGGAGVLEKPPALDTSWLEKLYQTESGGEGSKEKQNKRTGGGDQFRVLLVDSPKHTEKRVTNVLPRVVPNVSSEAARGIFEESKVKGFGIVIVCVKEYAETYCQLLIRNGLSSRIEPDADTV